MSSIVNVLLPWIVPFAISAASFGLVLLVSRILKDEDDQKSALFVGCIVFSVALGVAAPLYFGMPETWAFPFVVWACNLAIVGVLLRWDARSFTIAIALWCLGFGALANYILFRYAPDANSQIALKASALLLFTISTLLFFFAYFQRQRPNWFERYVLGKQDPRFSVSGFSTSTAGVVSGASAVITQAKDAPLVHIILAFLHLTVR